MTCWPRKFPLPALKHLAQLGRYEEALEQAQALENRLRELGAEEDAAKVVANAGNIYFQRETYADALSCWQRALDYFKSQNAAMPVARLQMNIANVLTHLSRLSEALEMYAAARTVLEAAGLDLLVAGLDGNRGFLLFMSGRYAEALTAYEQARQRFETLGQPKDLAKCDREIADVYLALNLIPEALAAYERALPVFRDLKMTLETTRSQTGLAGALFAQNKSAEALQMLAEAEQTLQGEHNEIGAARLRLLRAQHLHRAEEGRKGTGNREQETGETQSAIGNRQSAIASSLRSDVSRALRAFRRHKLPLAIAQARLLRSEMGVLAGQKPTHTLTLLRKEAEINEWITLLWRIETALARAAMNAGKSRAALNRYRRAVQAVERLRQLMPGEDFRVAFFQDKMRLHEEMLELLLERDTRQTQEEAFHIIERVKSRTLLEQMVALRQAKPASDAAGQASLQRLEDLRAQLNWNHATQEQFDTGDARFQAGSANPGPQMQQLEQEFLRAQRQAQMRNGAGKEAAPAAALTLDSLQTLLDGEQIIEYVLLKEEVLACVVERGKVRVARSLASLSEVRDLLERLRFQWTKMRSGVYAERFEAQLRDTARRILHRLYKLLWEPLTPYLTEQQITIIPHGILHEVPFHALFDGGRYVVDDWECAYAPSSGVWHNCRQREDVKAVDSLLLGVSDPGISYVRAEAESLQLQIPNLRVLREEAATLAAVPTEGTYCYLHFATHALFRQDNPLFSGLKLWDGWLIAYDLYHRRLECDLATLSACDTGLNLVTAGDELLGLTRGFLAAGARSVLACLWAAHDPTTAQLMPAFYARLAAGMGKAEALRASQRELRERFPHPYYWASFALSGAR